MRENDELFDRTSKHGGPISGLAVFALSIILMIFAAAPAQYLWGMAGLVLTEIMLAALGLAAALVLRLDLRKVFPLSRPSGRQVAATLFIWAGYLGLALSSSMAMAYFFPDEVFGISEQLGETFTSVGPALMLFIVALTPAICEEVLCRGFIQYTFRRVKARWLVISVMAVLFGVMHLSIYRFLPTAILGFALAYLREKSGGLALPMLLHLVNNCFSSLASSLAGTANALSSATADITATIPALAFFYSIGAPLLIFLGVSLFDPARPLGERHKMTRARRMQFIAALVFTALFALGFMLNAAPLAQQSLAG